MRYPKFLENGSTIGITATSAGVAYKLKNYEKSIENLNKMGYKIYETANVRNNSIRSSSPEDRALQLKEIYEDNSVEMIMCATGGMFQFEIMPYINYNVINKNIKWIMGYSDPTSLLYTITTSLDIATLYGFNAGGYDQDDFHRSLTENLEILKGNIIKQNSFNKYEIKDYSINNFSGYNLTEKVKWINVQGNGHLEGRCIGGCLDVLAGIPGTPYDNTAKFVEKYKEDGIVWYFDICELSSSNVYLSLLQLKYSGWFKYATGVIVGRVAVAKKDYDMTYKEAFTRVFNDIPIIMEADIGHVAPHMTLINGAMVNINCDNEKGSIGFVLK